MNSQNETELKQKAALLSAMANARRLHVLMVLQHSEISVTRLAEVVGLSQSALSQHLSKLKRSNLVSTRRDVHTIYYTSRDTPAINILKALSAIFCNA
ncbi:ArsR/SmtB family transcription factor [Agrobacterium salinitolerans]